MTEEQVKRGTKIVRTIEIYRKYKLNWEQCDEYSDFITGRSKTGQCKLDISGIPFKTLKDMSITFYDCRIKQLQKELEEL